MPEPIATIWLIIIGSGGYVLAVVQFFKDFLNLKKLELEVEQLRRARTERENVVVRATPDEVARFGRPLAPKSSYRATNHFFVLAIALAGTGLFISSLVYERSGSLATIGEHGRNREIEMLQRRIEEGQVREEQLTRDRSKLMQELRAAHTEIEQLKRSELPASAPSASAPR